VYQAEVTAIQKAAEHLYRLDERQHKKVTYILSDSRSALQALQKHWVSSKTLHKCIKSLNDLASKTEVRLRWIKAHVNHKGNEMADSLAKAGAVAHMQDVNLNGLVVEDLNEVPPPYSHLVNIVTKGVEKLWSDKWMEAKKVDGSPLYRQSKYFFKTPNKQKAYNLLRTDRHTLGKAIQFITGHSFLKRHVGLLAQAKDPTLTPDITCRLCKKGEETPFHLVMECEELFVERRRLFRQQPDNPTDPDCTVRWRASALIRFVNLDVINQMLNSEEEDIFLRVTQTRTIRFSIIKSSTPGGGGGGGGAYVNGSGGGRSVDVVVGRHGCHRREGGKEIGPELATGRGDRVDKGGVFRPNYCQQWRL
jgi:hypothetical protein